MEHESLDAEQPELTGDRAEIVEPLLHGIADKDQRADPAGFCLVADVAEHLADLSVAAAAIDFRHERGEPLPARDETRGAALAEAAEINQLHVEAAEGGGRFEHAALQR